MKSGKISIKARRSALVGFGRRKNLGIAVKRRERKAQRGIVREDIVKKQRVACDIRDRNAKSVEEL